MNQSAANLEQILDRIGQADPGRQQVHLGAILAAVGQRGFAPFLLVAGLLMISPLSGIPGLATVVGILVLLSALQLLVGRRSFWLPTWLLRRQIGRTRLNRALAWLRPAARLLDRWLKPRLGGFVRGPNRLLIAVLVALIAVGMPLMELIPFSASLAGVALSAFGLALVADDGLLALLAYAVTGLVLTGVLMVLL